MQNAMSFEGGPYANMISFQGNPPKHGAIQQISLTAGAVRYVVDQTIKKIKNKCSEKY